MAGSAYNNGSYRSEAVENLVQQLRSEFDPAKRSELAIQISQQLLDYSAFIYIAHLKMPLVMKTGMQNFTAHPCDYYEVTKDLTIN